jgi:hypothetical protein
MPEQVQVQVQKEKKKELETSPEVVDTLEDQLESLELSDDISSDVVEETTAPLVGLSFEDFASDLSVEECMDVLKGEDQEPDVKELLTIIGQSTEFESFLQAHHPGVWKRMGKQLKSPKFWASMIPIVNLAVIGNNIYKAQQKKTVAKQMKTGKSDVMDKMMDTQMSHQTQKRNVEIGKGVLAVTSLATGAAGATVGAAVTPMMGIGSELLSTGVSSGINTGVSTLTGLGVSQGIWHLSGDKDLSDDEVGDGSLDDYKTNRALLHYLGYAPRMEQEELDNAGVAPEQEAARILLKEQMGFDKNSELVGRDQTVKKGMFGRKTKDNLTEEERGWYKKLAKKQITIDEVPKEHRLAMAWEQGKVFETDQEMQKDKLKQLEKLPDVPTTKPEPKPGIELDEGLTDMSRSIVNQHYVDQLPETPTSLEDLKKIMEVETSLPDPPTKQDVGLSSMSDELVKTKQLDEI